MAVSSLLASGSRPVQTGRTGGLEKDRDLGVIIPTPSISRWASSTVPAAGRPSSGDRCQNLADLGGPRGKTRLR